MLTVADLDYDPVAHQTVAPDGRLVPHVTAVLAATGLSTDFGALAETSPRRREHIEMAGARGTVVHADCHAYDDNDLDWTTCDIRIRPYVEAWATCRERLGLQPLAHARERQVFDPHQWYTGILDGIFLRASCAPDWLVLVDLKTGDPDDAAAHLQTAAYAAAWELAHPEQRINERWAVQLTPQTRRRPFHKFDYTARQNAYQDYQKWLAALCTYNEQPERRGRVC